MCCFVVSGPLTEITHPLWALALASGPPGGCSRSSLRFYLVRLGSIQGRHWFAARGGHKCLLHDVLSCDLRISPHPRHLCSTILHAIAFSALFVKVVLSQLVLGSGIFLLLSYLPLEDPENTIHLVYFYESKMSIL